MEEPTFKVYRAFALSSNAVNTVIVGMMKALSGKGGEGMDPKAFEKMVGDLGGMEGMPDGMADASPEEMARMTSEALASVKQSLEEGSITREEVKELESIMGMDIKQLVALMDQGKVDKARLKREMGSEFGDVLELFRALAKIK